MSISATANKQRGVTLIEVLASLTVIAALTAGVARLMDQYGDDTKSAITAQHISAVGMAAQAYIKDNYAVIQAAATPTTPALITVPMLVATGYLSPGYSTANNYGQSTCVLVLEPTANMLNGLVVTEGGTTINDLTLGSIAGLVGANGGGVYSDSPTLLRGAMGAWATLIGNYANANASGQKCDGTAGTPSITAGHPIMALWFSNGDVSSGFIHRNAVAGHPELNTMNTPLLMSATTVVTPGTACTDNGAIARNTNGAVMSCQSLIWKSQGSAYWEDPVATYSALPVCSATNAWQTRVVEIPTTGSGPRAFTCDGSSWKALALDDAGSLTIPANLTVGGTATLNALNGNLQVTATAVEGGACSGEGRIAASTTTSGLLLSCQSSTWKSQGGSSTYKGEYVYVASWAVAPMHGGVGTCIKVNPLTSACSCPSGSSAVYVGGQYNDNNNLHDVYYVMACK